MSCLQERRHPISAAAVLKKGKTGGLRDLFFSAVTVALLSTGPLSSANKAETSHPDEYTEKR